MAGDFSAQIGQNGQAVSGGSGEGSTARAVKPLRGRQNAICGGGADGRGRVRMCEGGGEAPEI
jgi:hypothetical protein